MAKRKTRTIYRDSETGLFVKRKVWERSKAHGGTRYVRERIRAVSRRVVEREQLKTAVYLAPLVKTFFVTFKYANAKGTRQFDFIVKAKTCSDAYKFIAKFAQGNTKLAFPDGDPRTADYPSVLHYLESFGWAERSCADVTEGLPEYSQLPEGHVEYQ